MFGGGKRAFDFQRWLAAATAVILSWAWTRPSASRILPSISVPFAVHPSVDFCSGGMSRPRARENLTAQRSALVSCMGADTQAAA
jgi:hypothetical protein